MNNFIPVFCGYNYEIFRDKICFLLANNLKKTWYASDINLKLQCEESKDYAETVYDLYIPPEQSLNLHKTPKRKQIVKVTYLEDKKKEPIIYSILATPRLMLDRMQEYGMFGEDQILIFHSKECQTVVSFSLYISRGKNGEG